MIDVDDALLGYGSTFNEALDAYARSMKEAGETGWSEEEIDLLPWWRDDDDREIQSVDNGPYVDALGRSTGRERPELSAAEFLHAATELLGVSLIDLTSRGRGSDLVRARELLAVVGVERYGLRVTALAEVVGRHRVTVSSWVSRGSAKRTSDAGFRDRAEVLDRELADRTS